MEKEYYRLNKKGIPKHVERKMMREKGVVVKIHFSVQKDATNMIKNENGINLKILLLRIKNRNLSFTVDYLIMEQCN